MCNKKGADSLTSNLTKLILIDEEGFVNKVWEKRAKEID